MTNPIKIIIQEAEKDFVFYQMTDLHFSECDERDSDRLEFMIKRDLRFGRHQLSLFRDILSECEREGAEFLAITGDLLDKPSQANLECLEKILSEIKIPYSFCFGNHEWDDDLAFWHKKYQPLFKHPLPGHFLDINGVRLVFLENSNYQAGPEQLNVAKEALNGDLPCLFFFHIPLHLESLRQDTVRMWNDPINMGANDWSEANRKRLVGMKEDLPSTTELCELLKTHESVRGIFAGHLHFRHKDEVRPGVYQWVNYIKRKIEIKKVIKP